MYIHGHRPYFYPITNENINRGPRSSKRHERVFSLTWNCLLIYTYMYYDTSCYDITKDVCNISFLDFSLIMYLICFDINQSGQR